MKGSRSGEELEKWLRKIEEKYQEQVKEGYSFQQNPMLWAAPPELGRLVGKGWLEHARLFRNLGGLLSSDVTPLEHKKARNERIRQASQDLNAFQEFVAGTLSLGGSMKVPSIEELRGPLATATLAVPPTTVLAPMAGPFLRRPFTAIRAALPGGGRGAAPPPPIFPTVTQPVPKWAAPQPLERTTRYGQPFQEGSQIEAFGRYSGPDPVSRKTYKQPKTVRDMLENAEVSPEGRGIRLSGAGRQQLRGFLLREGDIQESAAAMGNVHLNAQGEPEFILGTFFTPLGPSTISTAPRQRMHVFVNPLNGGLFSIRKEPGPVAKRGTVTIGDTDVFGGISQRIWGRRLHKLATEAKPEEGPPFVGAKAPATQFGTSKRTVQTEELARKGGPDEVITAREAIEVPDGLSDSVRADFDRFNALTPNKQISRLQLINDYEAREPGQFLGSETQLTLKEAVEAATRGKDPRQLRRTVLAEKGAEVPEGDLLLKEGIWDTTDKLTRKYPGSPETNIIPGPNARTATGEVAQSLDEINIAASRRAAGVVPEVVPTPSQQAFQPITEKASLVLQRRLFGNTTKDIDDQVRRELQITRDKFREASPSPDVVVRRRRGTPQGKDHPTPRETYKALSDDLELPTFEEPSQGIMRKWEGSRNVVTLEVVNFFKEGQKTLRGMGFRAGELSSAEMRPLFEALHDRKLVPRLSRNHRRIYDDVKELQRREEDEMIEFLRGGSGMGARVLKTMDRLQLSDDMKNLATRFMVHPDYFPRLWKQRIPIPTDPGIATSRFTKTPSFTRARVDATFTEMIDNGWEPLTWDPYAMMSWRRMQGVNYRETTIMVNRLYERGLVLPLNEAPAKWRVPQIGAVFTGRPFLSESGDTIRTRSLAVPDGLAGELESFFRSQKESQVPEMLRKASNELKRFKLTGSLFQHWDFATRSLGAAYSPTGIRQMAPFKYPSLVARLMTSTWSEGYRGQLSKRILSNERMFPDFALTPRMVVEEGWGVTGDISFIQREIGDFLAQPALRKGLHGKAAEALMKTQDFFQSALFDGVYRESQLWALENFIVPWIRRTRPNATPRQVAAEAAEAVNVMFSTLGSWQTVLRKNPNLRDWVRTASFSYIESESLIRSFLRTLPPLPMVKGKKIIMRSQSPNAGLFREHYLGLFIGMGILANVINFTATGRELPLESYSPIKINDPYAPYKIGYNNRFLAPQLPLIKGRDGQPVYLDIVGQMDTALRWATDPVAAAMARTNVLPRAGINQFTGQTFFGQTLTPAMRIAQAAIDIAAPIGPSQLIGALREGVPSTEPFIPEAEGRLGVSAQVVQGITGLNLMSQLTPKLLDTGATDFGLEGSYQEQEPFVRTLIRFGSSISDELNRRSATAEQRNNINARYYAALDEVEVTELDQIREQMQRDNSYFPIYGIRKSATGQRIRLSSDRDFDDRNVNDPDPLKSARAKYYDAFSKARTKSGLFDKTLLDSELKKILVTSEQADYIIRNDNMRPLPRGVSISSTERSSRIRSHNARKLYLQSIGRTDLIPILEQYWYAEKAESKTELAPVGITR